MSHYRGNERVATFSEMLLLDFARHLDIPTIKHKILQSIDDSKDIRAIIVAMWQEQGNLAKTAQSLYIHRNSLQYKLEKFRLLSGLNLKILIALLLLSPNHDAIILGILHKKSCHSCLWSVSVIFVIIKPHRSKELQNGRIKP